MGSYANHILEIFPITQMLTKGWSAIRINWLCFREKKKRSAKIGTAKMMKG